LTNGRVLEAFDFEYLDTPPEDLIESNSTCSAGQNAKIAEAVQAVRGYLNDSNDNEDPALFKKWFGESTQESDDVVRMHMNDATNMFNLYESGAWTVMCCDQAIGACTWCTGDTEAYVMSYTSWVGDGPVSTFNSTWIRYCPDPMTEDTVSIGMTLYHEVVHMTSDISDDPVRPYAKDDVYTLAADEPEAARHNSQNYMYYAGQNGMPLEAYADFSGPLIYGPNCIDRYSNCNNLAEGCCGDRVGDYRTGEKISDWCCASCKMEDATPFCVDKLSKPPCNDRFTDYCPTIA